jgi:hypothetical protein
MVAALVLACAEIDPPQIEPGADIAGNWLGCADNDCAERTLAGLHFESDGSVRSIQALPCPERKPCPGSVAVSIPHGVAHFYRCVCNLPLNFVDARWRWEEDYVVFSAFRAEWHLLTHLDRLQVPMRPRPGAPPFLPPLLYPDADWMVRGPDEVPECLPR